MGRPIFLDEELASLAKQKNAAATLSLGWRRWAEKLPTRMRGNFAFAVLDPNQNQASLVLDRIGGERLCYAYQAGQLVFGTSLQSVAAHPAVGRVIDPQSIYAYLYFHTIPAPGSLYQGVHKLLPGQIITLKNGRLHTDFYWQADYTPAGQISRRISAIFAMCSIKPCAMLTGQILPHFYPEGPIVRHWSARLLLRVARQLIPFPLGLRPKDSTRWNMRGAPQNGLAAVPMSIT